ncbi:hypothetical protein ACLHDG_03115 [Sulfurovum sp. CS9]|uniref:hypothetical protein n=1 Tax=Sulfurovum sp. CS9 TaxID=3391146 RepID=UPI0039E784F4
MTIGIHIGSIGLSILLLIFLEKDDLKNLPIELILIFAFAGLGVSSVALSFSGI